MNEIIGDESKRKKRIVFALVAVSVIGFVIAYYVYTSQKKYVPKAPEPVVNLQGKQDTAKESWMMQSSSQMAEQKKRIEDLEKMTKVLTTQLETSAQPGAKPGIPPIPMPGQPGQPGQPMQPTAQPSGKTGASQVGIPQLTSPGQQMDTTKMPPGVPPPPQPMLAQGQQIASATQPDRGPYADQAKMQQQKPMTNLIAIEEGKAAAGAAPQPASGKQEQSQQKGEQKKPTSKSDDHTKDSYLPAGSFVKVVLLNGIDAPSGSKGKGSPYPVLTRVMDLAIFPNLWKGDIRECFMIGEATGELSSERVHIRFNTLSCMSRKGELIESQVTAYAVGEDGKIALAGRVTSKQGAILARSLAAGFIQGVSQAFNYSQNTLNVTPTGNVMTVDPAQAAQAGISQGFAQAASELSRFYMELNREMSPVIEINAGRQCEVVFLNQTKLGKRGGK